MSLGEGPDLTSMPPESGETVAGLGSEVDMAARLSAPATPRVPPRVSVIPRRRKRGRSPRCAQGRPGWGGPLQQTRARSFHPFRALFTYGRGARVFYVVNADGLQLDDGRRCCARGIADALAKQYIHLILVRIDPDARLAFRPAWQGESGRI